MKKITILCALLFAASFSVYAQELPKSEMKLPPDINDRTYYPVWRVIDGDTLKLYNDKRVVLSGIDAPELFLSRKMYDQFRTTRDPMENIKLKGKIVARYTRELVQGKRVRLEFDERKRDKREQILAYVFLEDGTFVNAELVKQGYAKVMTIPPNEKYKDLFKQLEEEAKTNKRGLWQYEN